MNRSRKVEDMKMEKRFEKYHFQWSERAEKLAQYAILQKNNFSLITYFATTIGLANNMQFLRLILLIPPIAGLEDLILP